MDGQTKLDLNTSFREKEQVQLSLKLPACPAKYTDKQIRPKLLLEGEGTGSTFSETTSIPGEIHGQTNKIRPKLLLEGGETGSTFSETTSIPGKIHRQIRPKLLFEGEGSGSTFSEATSMSGEMDRHKQN